MPQPIMAEGVNHNEPNYKKQQVSLRYDLLRNWLILYPNNPLYFALIYQSSSSQYKECEAKCYERCKILFGVEGKNRCYNLEKASFPTAKVNWGTFYHIALFDQPKNGKMIYLERIQCSPIIVEAGTTVMISAEEITDKKNFKLVEKKVGILISFGNNGVVQEARSFQKQIF